MASVATVTFMRPTPSSYLALKVTLPMESTGRTRVCEIELGHQEHRMVACSPVEPFYVDTPIDYDMPEVRGLIAAMRALEAALVVA